MPKLIGKPQEQVLDIRMDAKSSLDYTNMTSTETSIRMAQSMVDNILFYPTHLYTGNKAAFGYMPNGVKFVCYSCGNVLGIFANSEKLMLYMRSKHSNYYWSPINSEHGYRAKDAINLGKVVNFFNNLPTKKTEKRWAFRQKEGLVYFPEKPKRENKIHFIIWSVNND